MGLDYNHEIRQRENVGMGWDIEIQVDHQMKGLGVRRRRVASVDR